MKLPEKLPDVSDLRPGTIKQRRADQILYSAALKRIEGLEEEVRLDNKEMIKDAYAIRELKKYDLRQYIPIGKYCKGCPIRFRLPCPYEKEAKRQYNYGQKGLVLKHPKCPNKKGEG